MNAKTAVIYTRVSTVRQANDELPLESQLEQCIAKAEGLDAQVVKVFSDGGKSGTTDNRPAFQDAIAFCELYAPTYFITWSTSRFARNRLDAGLYKRRLDKAQTKIVYVSTPIDRDTDSGYLIEGVYELFDEHYSRNVRADARRSMIKNARDGNWNGGVTPFGYQSAPADDNPRRKRLHVLESEAEIVRRIFDMRINGIGAFTIANILNQEEIPARKGRKWSKKAILGALRSEAVLGRIVFNKYNRETKTKRPRDQWIIVDSHPAIIDQDKWSAAQDLIDDMAAISDNRTAPNSTWAFSGLLKCGICGNSMQIDAASGRSKRYNYYKCNRARMVGDCEGQRYPAETMDEWLLEEVLNKILSSASLEKSVRELKEVINSWEKDNRREIAVLARKREEITHKITKIYELFELLGKDTPNLGDLTKRLRKHNDNIKKIEAQITILESQKPPSVEVNQFDIDEMVELVGGLIRSSSDPQKVRGFLGTFINSITIKDGDAEIKYDKALLINQVDTVHSKRKWWAVGAMLRTTTLKLKMPFQSSKRKTTSSAGKYA